MASARECVATFTFIRHGQSTNNGKPIWAGGGLDSPLSEHGLKEAELLGTWFSNSETKFDTIYVSKLKRARQTANAIEHHTNTKPPLIEHAFLHEISFGEADGKPYVAEETPGLSLEDHYKQGVYPHIRNRTDRFPGGESKEDVARRAEEVIQELIVPAIKDTANGHIAIVSHGVFLRELFYALHRRTNHKSSVEYKYLDTTGWTRMKIGFKIPADSQEALEPSLSVLDVTHINVLDHLAGT
ncbi:hypothetical protein VKT23_006564 [Stygiomarasmius scandens]|uniref:Phosphoglycerate mutase n=1 Tax=Marasmiellus scandens TaxID=2682957 RepID=A0ABR1JSJ2_9AGAR